MAATLTATPNPAGVWGESGSRSVTVSWNTGSALPGRVYLKVIGGSETLFGGDPVSGDLSGTKPLTVTFGSTYSLVLRQVSNNAVLATVGIPVFDLAADAGVRGAATAALLQRINPGQAIFDLKVVPGIDTVRVSFRTSQPTIPVIQVTATDGTEIASSFALGAGMRTQHQATLGGPAPLPQASLLDLRIIASGRDFRGHPHDARANLQFMTGSRHAAIYFEVLKVTRDGDIGMKGEGEFIFVFGAGSVPQRKNLGQPWPTPLEQDIDENDSPIALDREINLEKAPRTIWVAVTGTEDDRTTYFNPGLGFYRIPTYDDDGSRFFIEHEEDQTRVTRHFDTDRPDGTIIPMTLATGDYPVAFTVTGHIFLRSTPGPVPVVRPFAGINPITRDRALLVDAGKIARLVPAPGRGREADPASTPAGHALARGADGALYRRLPLAEDAPDTDGAWRLAAPAVEGAVTCIARAENRLTLLALDLQGEICIADIAGDESAGEWRSLGGGFTDRLAAVARGAAVELFALDREGAVRHRRLSGKNGAKGSAWRKVGEGATGELAAVPIGDDDCAVFVLGRAGKVLHRRLCRGVWQTDGWQTIQGATGNQLGVVPEGAQGISLALIDEKMRLQTLQWPSYPKKQPDWVSQGDLQSWLVRAEKLPDAGPSGKTRSRAKRA